MSAVDIGAAEGDITGWIAERFREVEAIELMDTLHATLFERFESVEHVSVRRADIADQPLVGQSDVVFLLGVLHYFSSEHQRRSILTHCLEHTGWLCFMRTGIRDFRLRDQRQMELADRYTTLRTLLDMDPDGFDMCVIDNGYRGVKRKRLGDLAIYRRRAEGNPFPSLKEMFSCTRGYLHRGAVERRVCCDGDGDPVVY
ncbi:MAG: class I SAM-dependent methyltransferase [Phycisphaerales bacterium]|nr:class I SAM-dependent methyltransferase [Phycisphaerales bacterium]